MREPSPGFSSGVKYVLASDYDRLKDEHKALVEKLHRRTEICAKLVKLVEDDKTVVQGITHARKVNKVLMEWYKEMET